MPYSPPRWWEMENRPAPRGSGKLAVRRKPRKKYIRQGIRTAARVPRGAPADLNFVDYPLNQAINTTAAVAVLNGIAPGTGGSQRTGRKAIVRSFHIVGQINADTAAIYNGVRLSLVLDKQPAGAAAAFTDIYDLVGGTAYPWSPLNISNARRFRVLWSENYILTSNGTAPAAANSLVPVQKYMKLNIPMQFNAGTAGTIADIESGALYLVLVGSAVAGTADAGIFGNVRLRFEP